jgi:hypothetical protein
MLRLYVQTIIIESILWHYIMTPYYDTILWGYILRAYWECIETRSPITDSYERYFKRDHTIDMYYAAVSEYQ